ncbi:aminotransferase class I/II-fold pyridoxal phosphate-dependent enzyme [bacterium]|nr:aminotransferase class I/II-fold pyridoxal phosphate-dependent enzyme [bacterium]
MTLLNMLKKGVKRTLFTTPSHNQKAHADKFLDSYYKIDYSEIEGFDNLHNPLGEIFKAQIRCAKVYGAKSLFFLNQGSTQGILASILTVASVGDKILIARNCHKSVLNGTILAKCDVDWIMPEYDENFGIYKEINPENLENILKFTQYKAFVITSPTYDGVISDIEKIAKICRQYGVILIVDEAHGSLLNFAEGRASAISQGADLVVNSLHKNAGAINPAAILMIGENSEIERDEVQKNLNLITTTSPSYPLLANIESIINFLASSKGKKEIEKLIKNIRKYKEKIKELGFEILEGENIEDTKISIRCKNGLSEELFEKHNIEDEEENENSLLFLCGIGTNENKLKKLYNALKKCREYANAHEKVQKEPFPCTKIQPHKAHKIETTITSKNNALHKISGETIIPYPPCRGIIYKGEIIQEYHLDFIEENVEVIDE